MFQAALRVLLIISVTVTAGICPVWGASSEAVSEHPSKQLVKEHDITLKMLDAASQEAAQIRKSGTLNAQRILKMHDFFTNFVDRCHHAKEERFYFPAARFYDGERIDRLVAELSNEHDYARTLLQEIAYMVERKEEPDPTLVADRLDRYAEIIRAHIGKENQRLYPPTDLVLPEAEKDGMLAGFARIEKQELGAGFHKKYHDLAMEVLER